MSMLRSKYGDFFNEDLAVGVASIPLLVGAFFFDALFLSAPGWFNWPMLHNWLWPIYGSGMHLVAERVPTSAAFALSFFWPIWAAFIIATALYASLWLCYKLSPKPISRLRN